MRALRVVGLADGGKTVICEDPARGERFTLPADERLRAAARGDVTRLGQIEIELESQMRPREIQARIRAGESVDQVAEVAGIPASKVERFAYPVLLERSRTADLAQRAHPVREDGPDLQTLGEICLHAFTLRGQDYTVAEWDSWRGEDGKWVVQLCWQAGRSLNRAHWSFHPGARGGTVTPLDEHAHDLLDPQPTRPLRTVRPVTELAQAALNIDPTLLPSRPEPAALEASPVGIGEIEPPVAPVPSPATAGTGTDGASGRGVAAPGTAGQNTTASGTTGAPGQRATVPGTAVPGTAGQSAAVSGTTVPGTTGQSAAVSGTTVPGTAGQPAAVSGTAGQDMAAPGATTPGLAGHDMPGQAAAASGSATVTPRPIAASAEATSTPTAPADGEPATPEPTLPAAEVDATGPTAREQQDFVEDFELTSPADAPADIPDQAALIEEPTRKTEPPRRAKGKKARPIVPSWEDVLLGTRSNRG